MGGGGSNRMFPSSPKPDAVQWGGVVADFFVVSKARRVTVGGGGSNRMFPSSPKPDAVQWGG